MKNYFTSIENVNEKFIGTVHDASNNQLVFRTPVAHSTPAEAIQEVNNFLQQQNNDTVSLPAEVQASISSPSTDPVVVSSEPPQARRCCGR